jgi:GTP cyclohydrolase II
MPMPDWIDTKVSIWHAIQLGVLLIGLGVVWGDLKANNAVLFGQVEATKMEITRVRSEYLRQDVAQAQNETTTSMLNDLRDRMQRIEAKLDSIPGRK